MKKEGCATDHLEFTRTVIDMKVNDKTPYRHSREGGNPEAPASQEPFTLSLSKGDPTAIPTYHSSKYNPPPTSRRGAPRKLSLLVVQPERLQE